jgi:hypothetical protein
MPLWCNQDGPRRNLNAAFDPGAAYHNGRYAGQLLYDSLDSLAASGNAGVDMRGKERP